MVVGAFENFWNISFEIYELDPAKFLSAPGLAWQAPLKKTKVKLDVLTIIDVLLVVEKSTRGGEHVTLIMNMQKLITNMLIF